MLTKRHMLLEFVTENIVQIKAITLNAHTNRCEKEKEKKESLSLARKLEVILNYTADGATQHVLYSFQLFF